MAIVQSFQKQLIGAGVIGIASFAASYASAGTVLLDGFGELVAVEVGEAPVVYNAFPDSDIPSNVATLEVTGSADSGVVPVAGGAGLSTGVSGPATFTFTYSFDPTDLTLVESFMLDVDPVGNSDIDIDFSVVLLSDGDEGTLNGDFIGSDTVLSFFLAGFSFDATFDVTTVDGLILTITSSAGDDFVIDNFKAVLVPSPTAAGFGILGLAAMAFRRRR